MNLSNTTLPTHDEIALCAFLLWEKEGRQSGRETTYWLQAEAQLRMARQQEAELAAKAIRPWPPAAAAPKVATARAVTSAAPKAPRLAASRAVIGKPASGKRARKAGAASSPKALARN